jgi:hypothetical protein
MLPASWKPVAADDLVRLGSAGDGGYVVSKASVAASTMLLSMGLNDDWRFEEAFRARSGARVICFDHSVNVRFWMLHALKQAALFRIGRIFHYFSYRAFFRGDVEHRQIKIGYDGDGETSVATLLKGIPDQAIFLKVDIEGSEFRILDDVLANADRFTAMVFEFHDIDLHRARLARFIEGLKDFTILDANGNNYGGTDAQGDPLVIEMSLVRSSYLVPASGDVALIGGAVRNDPRQAPILLSYAEAA